MHHMLTAYFNYRGSLLFRDYLCFGQPTASESPLREDQDFILDSAEEMNKNKNGKMEF